MSCSLSKMHSFDHVEPSISPSTPSPEALRSATEPKDLFTPQKRYRTVRSPRSKRIRIAFTPSAKAQLKKSKVPMLYSWKRGGVGTECEKRLIGFTSQPDGRLASYLWACNHPEKANGDFFQDLREHPEQFSFGKIRDLKPHEDSGTAETEAIREKDSIHHGYNKRLGGGGGQCQSSSKDEPCPYTLDQIVSMIRENYNSPCSKPLRRLRGRVSLDLSASDKRLKNVIYEFLFDPTGEKKDRIHHPGYTTTTLGQRMSSHLSCINHPESQGFKTISLYNQIKAHPEQVKVRIFNVDELLKKKIPLPMLETAFMEFFKQRGETVRNYGAGAKGSISKASSSAS